MWDRIEYIVAYFSLAIPRHRDSMYHSVKHAVCRYELWYLGVCCNCLQSFRCLL